MFLQFDQCVGWSSYASRMAPVHFPVSSKKIPHARTINFPSISGTTRDHQHARTILLSFFPLLLLFTFASFPPCHFHNVVDRNFAQQPCAVRTEFLWGFARRLVHRRRAITVPCYVRRSHLSRLDWTKGCTTGRWIIIIPTRGEKHGGRRKKPALPSDI